MKVISIRRLRLLFIILLILFGIVYFLQAKWFWRVFYPDQHQSSCWAAFTKNHTGSSAPQFTAPTLNTIVS
jgi:hypothetical protein